MGFVPELDRLRNWKIYLFRIEYVKPLKAVLKYLAGLKFLFFYFHHSLEKYPTLVCLFPNGLTRKK